MTRRIRAEEPNLFALRCQECGKQLVKTASGFLACPNGHGKLIREEREEMPEVEPWGSWFGE